MSNLIRVENLHKTYVDATSDDITTCHRIHWCFILWENDATGLRILFK